MVVHSITTCWRVGREWIKCHQCIFHLQTYLLGLMEEQKWCHWGQNGTNLIIFPLLHLLPPSVYISWVTGSSQQCLVEDPSRLHSCVKVDCNSSKNSCSVSITWTGPCPFRLAAEREEAAFKAPPIWRRALSLILKPVDSRIAWACSLDIMLMC